MYRYMYTYDHVVHVHHNHFTQSFRLLFHMQFQIVLRRCGGSDIKKRGRTASGANMLFTFLIISPPSECSFHKHRFVEAPSYVIDKTRIPCPSSREMASQTGSMRRSPLSFEHANCAYGNLLLRTDLEPSKLT